MSGNSSDNVKAIFGRCLLTCPFLELWKLYLGFIKRSNEGEAFSSCVVSEQDSFALTKQVSGHDTGFEEESERGN